MSDREAIVLWFGVRGCGWVEVGVAGAPASRVRRRRVEVEVG